MAGAGRELRHAFIVVEIERERRWTRLRWTGLSLLRHAMGSHLAARPRNVELQLGLRDCAQHLLQFCALLCL